MQEGNIVNGIHSDLPSYFDKIFWQSNNKRGHTGKNTICAKCLQHFLHISSNSVSTMIEGFLKFLQGREKKVLPKLKNLYLRVLALNPVAIYVYFQLCSEKIHHVGHYSKFVISAGGRQRLGKLT